MTNDKLEKAIELRRDIKEISEKLNAFMDVGTDERAPKTVRIEGAHSYRADDVISKHSLKVIRSIVISDLQELLEHLTKEYEEL